MRRRKQMCEDREKMAIYKPRRETRDKFFSQGPQEEQTLRTHGSQNSSLLKSQEIINMCCVSYPVCSTQLQWHPKKKNTNRKPCMLASLPRSSLAGQVLQSTYKHLLGTQGPGCQHSESRIREECCVLSIQCFPTLTPITAEPGAAQARASVMTSPQCKPPARCQSVGRSLGLLFLIHISTNLHIFIQIYLRYQVPGVATT